MKECSKCKIEKDLSEFGIAPRNSDGLRKECKECKNKSDREMYSNRTVFQKANKIFNGIQQRCTNERIHKYRARYAEVRNKLDRDEFVSWYQDNYFDKCQVDRIDNNKDYEISNIQLLSTTEHNLKKASERIDIVSNKAICSKCRNEYDYSTDSFWVKSHLKSKYNPLGIISVCKECKNSSRLNKQKLGA